MRYVNTSHKIKAAWRPWICETFFIRDEESQARLCLSPCASWVCSSKQHLPRPPHQHSPNSLPIQGHCVELEIPDSQGKPLSRRDGLPGAHREPVHPPPLTSLLQGTHPQMPALSQPPFLASGASTHPPHPPPSTQSPLLPESPPTSLSSQALPTLYLSSPANRQSFLLQRLLPCRNLDAERSVH